MVGDTAEASTHEAAVAEAVRRWGRLDVYVNNAAIGVGGDALEAKGEGGRSTKYSVLNVTIRFS